jgi:hypothetical protein
MELLSVA